MSDDDILREWAKAVQDVEPDAGSAETVFRRVKVHEGQVREAARKLPFESEPAIFRVLLDGKAKGEDR
tara:strand:+ start:233 stop:436 length:204 start_codon:yes stop_codon:yes gene_type:complete